LRVEDRASHVLYPLSSILDLQSRAIRQLIDADTRKKVAEELLPMHTTLLRIWEQYPDDPTLYRQGQICPADAAKVHRNSTV
jgi:hypothetical protein